MSVNASSDGASLEPDKPAQASDDVKFPPLPEPSDTDFEDDVGDEEKAHYRSKFPDLNEVINIKLHCTACDRHLGCSAKNESRMRSHPMLKTLICHACHSFYNSGEFDKGEDGSELYCRWCGQGGQVYCCSDCIHVFCAKCIKRNFGLSKIKEIENTDDWKCFKCNPKCLWDLRAVCWALLHFCELRTRIVSQTDDSVLKDKYMKIISVDSTECCRNKGRRKTDFAKKKEKEAESVAKKIISKMPPTIQVKKFASINMDDTPKIEKKAQKRPASPKNKMQPIFMSKPIAIAPSPNNMVVAPLLKKIRLPNAPLLTPIRMGQEKKHVGTYNRYAANRPRAPFPIPIVNSPFNGFNNTPVFNNAHQMNSLHGDNINLSLETLTQGLDMSAVAAFNNSQMSNEADNDVVCTPDFPMEPLCEVTEDNDDDVECITPGPLPKISEPPPLVSRISNITNDNIVQMTENDVTVNALTGGLKFRVDPQTLSSKKMYRLPDGRIFAINPNPSMPGGYSATIVSVSEMGGKLAPKTGETYAAKLSSVTSSKPTPSKPGSKNPRNSMGRKNKNRPTILRAKQNLTSKSKEIETESTENRKSDFKVPIEWYRYNLIDAVDALEYSLTRLNKLKKDTPTARLRTRTVDEMKYLHRTLEQLLTTSSKRFIEIRDNLNRELKLFISQKTKGAEIISEDEDDDDDDVEILADAPEDPIFIDENSVDSINNTQEVDLTGAASSEHNDSVENKNDSDPLHCTDITETNQDVDKSADCLNSSVDDNTAEKPSETPTDKQDKDDEALGDDKDTETENSILHDDAEINNDSILPDEERNNDKDCDKQDKSDKVKDTDSESEKQNEVNDKVGTNESPAPNQKSNELNGDAEKEINNDKESMDVSNEPSETQDKAEFNDEKTQGLDMSEDLINTLLQDDNLEAVDNVFNTNSLDIPDDLLDKE